MIHGAPLNEATHPPPRVEYHFANNVYRDGLGAYALVGGLDRTWNGWLNLGFTGPGEALETITTFNAGTLQPTGTVVQTAGNPLFAGDGRAWNGVSYYPAGAACYAGAFQPFQSAVTNFMGVQGPGSGHVTLTWTPVGSPSGYWIHYDDDPGGSQFQRTASAPVADIPSLNPGTLYFFRVMAFNLDGSLSRESTEIQVLAP